MRRWVRTAAVGLLLVLTACTAAPAPGPPVLRDTAPPWPAPRDGLAQIRAAGVETSRLDDTTGQRRFRLAITLDGRPVPLVPWIGMDRPRALQGPAHTHDDSGEVWLEGRGADTVTLGQFFVLWGVRLDERCLGAACGTVVVTADGAAVPNPTGLVLAGVREQVEVRVSSA